MALSQFLVITPVETPDNLRRVNNSFVWGNNSPLIAASISIASIILIALLVNISAFWGELLT